MPVTQPYNLNGVTVSTTEISVVSGTSTLQAVADPIFMQVVVDGVGSALAKADRFRLRIYEKCLTGSTKRVAMEVPIEGVQTQLIWTPSILVMWGWDVTLLKVAGTDRSMIASIRKVAE